MLIKNFLILLLAVSIQIPLLSQTEGSLEVSVSTSDAGGNYKPRNIIAIWVEDVQGNFVKTLMAYADKRKTHLNTWQAATDAAGTEYNTVDAITGATRSSHSIRNCNWDGTNYMGDKVEDGTYHLKMELTDKNATGNSSSFVFEKSENEQVLSPVNEPSFSDILISWLPDQSSSLNNMNSDKEIVLVQNPVRDRLQLVHQPKYPYRIINANGAIIYKGSAQFVELNTFDGGLYFIVFQDGQQTRFIKME